MSPSLADTVDSPQYGASFGKQLGTHLTRTHTPVTTTTTSSSASVVTPRPPQSVFQSMWTGATAGMCGIIAVYPIDVVKTRMQHSRVSSSAVQVVGNIIKHEGAMSFYKGLGPQLLGTAPDKAVSFAAREYVKGKFNNSNALAVSVASGVASGVSQSIVMSPVEIVKVRMQIDSSLTAAGVIRELGLRGVYRGYVPCVLRDVLCAATYFTLYDYAKQRLQIEDGSSLGWSMVAGSTAGIPAAFFTTPFDMLKTRMQSRGAAQIGFRATFQQVYSEGGISALFAGWGPRVSRIAPQIGIFLVSYDWLQHRFGGASH